MKELIAFMSELGFPPLAILMLVFLILMYRTMTRSSKELNKQIIGEFSKEREGNAKIIAEHKADVKEQFDVYRKEDKEWRDNNTITLSQLKDEQKLLVENQEKIERKYNELKMYDEMRKRLYANGDIRFLKSTKREYITKMFKEFERGILSWDDEQTYTKNEVLSFYEELNKNVSSEFVEKYRKFGFDDSTINVIKTVDGLISPITWNMMEDIINTFLDKERYNGTRNEVVKVKVDNYMNQYINKWNQLFDEYTHTLPVGV